MSGAFPDPVYADTVLAPLFEGVKTHHARNMMAINKAHLVMLAETGILPRPEARKIAQALADIEAGTDIDALTYTGEHEDYFFLVEARLRDRLGDLGGALHTARSRNDMDHTLFRMALRDRTAGLAEILHTLATELIVKARAERTTLIVAYTHGQPAQPTIFGHYLGAVIETLLGDGKRLVQATQALADCPMGAAAITTSGFPIDRPRVAALLGFDRPKLNSYGCIASVDYITGLYSALKLMFLHLGRVIQDLAFWAAFEVGQLHVPDSLVQISSIMPQKRNPVPIEHMRHLASAAMGHCDTIINTMHNTPFTDMNDSEGEVQQTGYAAFETGGRMLQLLTAFLPACSINGTRVRQNADAACITITELADTLVRTESMTFREAHEIAAATARAVIADGTSLSGGYPAFSAAFRNETGRATGMTHADFAAAVAMDSFVARRDRPGGPAPATLDAALDAYVAESDAVHMDFLRHSDTRKSAESTLASAFAALLES
ncbi:MAG: argininosuccinate lyase [Rhodobacter sp.]|nr:argininosuccinate lyase [Rhodobacter sp.]